ncbi:MAG: hypothetical protein AB8H86_11720 [Polyangiales bacterium]
MKNAILFLAVALAVGCTDDPTTPAAECVPSEADWNESVQTLVMENCGTCHGDTPDFGAPFTLLDYQAITAGIEGERIVDEMHRQLSAGTMPPRGSATPTLEHANAIAGWASCGEVTIEDTSISSRTPFTAPDDAPEGLRTIDVLAGDLAIAPDQLDDYEDIDFTNLTEEDVFIRRFEAVIDASQVVHHLTLRRGDPAMGDSNMKYLYAWAPGTGAIEFPDGGVRLRPGDNLRLQIHYNNGPGLEGIRDSSGVRLFVGPVEGLEYEMADPGPGAAGFRIPARSSETVESTCTITEPVRAIASMPHMHENGTAFDLLLQRGAGAAESILELFSWSFETQLFYNLPIDLEAGDELTVRCDFQNNTDDAIFAGPRTADEMCFAFTYVTPPPQGAFCVQGGDGTPTVLEYEPGMCFASPETELSVESAEIVETGPEFDATGTLPDGRFVIERFILVTPDPGLVGLATITAAAQLERSEGIVSIDGAFHFIAPTDGLRTGVQNEIQVNGTLNEDEGPSALTVTCPEEDAGDQAGITFGTVEGSPAAMVNLGSNPVPIVMWFVFEPAE